MKTILFIIALLFSFNAVAEEEHIVGIEALEIMERGTNVITRDYSTGEWAVTDFERVNIIEYDVIYKKVLYKCTYDFSSYLLVGIKCKKLLIKKQ